MMALAHGKEGGSNGDHDAVASCVPITVPRK